MEDLNNDLKTLSDIEVSKITGINVFTLRTWRKRGYGPVFLKEGGGRGRILYPEKELKKWFSDLRRQESLK